MRRWRAAGGWLLVALTLAAPAGAQKAAKYRLGTNPGVLLKRAEELAAEHYYTAAAPLYARVLAAVEALRGPRDPDTLLLVGKLAGLDQTLGRYAEAEALYARLLEADRARLGVDHPDTAAALGNLAGVRIARGLYAEAEPLLNESLGLQIKSLGPDHPATLASLNNLAWLYNAQGRYPEAEVVFRRVLRSQEQKHGAQSLEVATSLNNLACLYSNLGRYAEAEALLRRALAINEQQGGPDHPDTVTTLSNLASVANALGRLEEAEALLRRALVACEKTVGAASRDAADLHNNLASVFNARGQYEAAEDELLRAADLYLDTLGSRHPTTATALNNLARLEQVQGRPLEAVVFAQRALAIRLRLLGPDHPQTALSLRNLADLAAATGNTAEALLLLKRAVQAENRVAAMLFGASTHKQRAEFAATLRESTDDLLTLCLQAGATDETVRRAGMDLLLQRKGWLLAAASEQSRAWRLAADPTCGATFRALQAVSGELSRLALSSPPPEQEEAFRQRWEELSTKQTSLEQRLVRESAELAGRTARRHTDLAAVAAALPAGSVLIEMAQYRPRQFRARGAEPRWGSAQYVAFVLRAGHQTPTSVVLGEVQRLDRAVARYRLASEERSDPSTQQMTAAAVHDLVWRPLEGLLGDATEVYLAPDGMLNLIAFPALDTAATGERHFLVERYTIRLVNSGRDLAPVTVPTGQGAALFGAPDYGAAPASPTPSEKTGDVSETAATGDLPGLLAGLSFPPLPGALTEVEQIAECLKTAQRTAVVASGAQATEERAKALKAPQLLHFATHGFFLPDVPVTEDDPLAAARNDPMLRSGLALARAQLTLSGQTPATGQDDGVLTAGEVCGLDLQGTALVVLSACDTGVGEVKAGEGVMGLRWAFAAAGAQSLVMSLWAVPDEATRLLMVDFYRRYLAGSDPATAMAAAQRAQLQQQRDANQVAPWQWGGFTVCQSAVVR